MANLNLELSTIALPIMLFLFTKSLKETITEKVIGREDLTKTILMRLDNLTSSKELSQAMKGMVYEIEMNRINFCEKYKGNQLTKADWDKINYNCINSSLHSILPVQLIPMWHKCSVDLDKFCININWIEMKGCLIESIFEQRIYYITLWFKDRLPEVLSSLLEVKSCIRRYAGSFIISKKALFLTNKSYG